MDAVSSATLIPPSSRLRRRRKVLKLSQAALGDLLGVSRKTVSRWECGTNAPARWVWVELDAIEAEAKALR